MIFKIFIPPDHDYEKKEGKFVAHVQGYSCTGGSLICINDISSALSLPSSETPALNSASAVWPSSIFAASDSSENCLRIVEILVPTSFDRSQTSVVDWNFRRK